MQESTLSLRGSRSTASSRGHKSAYRAIRNQGAEDRSDPLLLLPQKGCDPPLHRGRSAKDGNSILKF